MPDLPVLREKFQGIQEPGLTEQHRALMADEGDQHGITLEDLQGTPEQVGTLLLQNL